MRPSFKRVLAPVAAALLLVACSTPTTRYHSLLPPPESTATTPGAAAAPARRDWELLAVVVAVPVDRPQWVLQRADGSFQLLEHERWLAPLPDELHAALSLHLERLLRGVEIAGGPWRVALELRRWDAALDRASRLEALWTLASSAHPSRYCRSTIVQPAAAGIDGMSAAHRAAVAQLAERIAATLRDPLRAC